MLLNHTGGSEWIHKQFVQTVMRVHKNDSDIQYEAVFFYKRHFDLDPITKELVELAGRWHPRDKFLEHLVPLVLQSIKELEERKHRDPLALC